MGQPEGFPFLDFPGVRVRVFVDCHIGIRLFKDDVAGAGIRFGGLVVSVTVTESNPDRFRGAVLLVEGCEVLEKSLSFFGIAALSEQGNLHVVFLSFLLLVDAM